MSLPKPPLKVRLFVTSLSSEQELLEMIKTPLAELFGGISIEGPIHPWNYSPAYTEELGRNIQRRILVFKKLRDPEDLADWKLATIKLEEKFLCKSNGTGKRRINLDPGYISGSHVILASTKQYGNRVYLGEGIYADLTLHFDGKVFRPFKGWTLPDYSTSAIRQFFTTQRTIYRRQVQHSQPFLDKAELTSQE